MTTAMKLPAAVFEPKSSAAELELLASVPEDCTSAIFAPPEGTLTVEVTLKLTPLLAKPLEVITTLPAVAPPGTDATTLVGLQLVGVAVSPLKVTVPIVDPKFVPAIVTGVPTGPDFGLRLVMAGTDGAGGDVEPPGPEDDVEPPLPVEPPGPEGDVELPLPAGLNAAMTAAQKSVALREAVAALGPAGART